MSVRRHSGHRLARLAVTALSVGLVAVAATPEPDSPRLPNEQQACPEGVIADIQPQDAIIARLSGKDARIFIQSCLAQGPASRTPEFDQVLILSGPDVMGGTVAVIAQGECAVGHKFLGLLEFIHAQEMVQLFSRHPALQPVEQLDLAVLTQLAESGEPVAAFHVGFVKAMGRGTPRDRPGSIAWLQRSAKTGFEPAMLGLGMSLAGPGVIDEQLLPIGAQRPRDAETDLPQACYWLRQVAGLKGELARVAQSIYDDEVASRLTSKERQACRALLKERRK